MQALRSEFKERIARCHFVWPEMPLSSYDLAEEADIGLVSASSMAWELARLGVPVISFDHQNAPFPPDSFLEMPDTADGYFRSLRALLSTPASIDRIRNAFRFYHLYNLAYTIDISDVVPETQYEGIPPYRLPREAEKLRKAIVEGQDLLELN